MVLLIAGAAFVAACGKKGAPLAPLVRLPAAAQQVSAARVGREIYLTFTAPAVNVDRSTPVDLAYLDVHALTASALPRAGFIEPGTRIARLPVGGTAAGAVMPGTVVTLVDPVPDAAAVGSHRYYVVVPVSMRERPGAVHPAADVLLSPLPDAPTGAGATYDERQVTITWVPPVAPPALPTPVPAATQAPTGGRGGGAGTAASQPLTVAVNVYREGAASMAGAGARRAVRPRPLNAMPLAAPPFTEAVAFGAERCYLLRTVVGTDASAVESEPGARVCLTPADTFPPAPPSQVAAIATAGSINLVWEANAEPDLGGYIVLRGAVSDARLQAVTPVPITVPRFVDTAVVAGTRYVYAVVAVDKRTPEPNVSAESARVEETAQ